MSVRFPPVLALGLFMAQMFVVGVHSLGHADLEHDRDHHSVTVEVEVDVVSPGHFDCSLCSLAKVGGDKLLGPTSLAEIVSTCSYSNQFSATLWTSHFELSNRSRGPPALS